MKYLLLTIFLTSCASYIDKIHRQIDAAKKRSMAKENKQTYEKDPFATYRGNPFNRRYQDKRPINNPVTFSSATDHANKDPSVQRRYRPAKKRYRASDLEDNGSSGSLWAGNDKENFLFHDNKTKALGDIIIIQVAENLKNDISNELKMAFPKPQPKKKTDGKKDDPKAAGQQANTPATPPEEDTATAKVYDKISCQVVEIISKDYILVRGRKEVLFRKQKRYIDVQALIAKRDIKNNDQVNSEKILESRIFALR